MAFCTPVPTSAASPEGGGGLSPHSCADRGAADSECRYFWLWEGSDTIPPLHPDGVGFCWTPEDYVGDWDDDAATPDTSIPRCSNLSPGDARYATWGCAPFVSPS
jgi:hypothetical protein